MSSSPRYTTTNSTTSTHNHNHKHHSPPKLRLMCSTGGHILPRPHDKSLCYLGGDTRIISIHRHTTLHDLTNLLSKTLLQSPNSFTIKYQLPSEDLDSLISVTTDEDLENMIDEYERLNSSSRIRVFVFQTNPDSVSSIGSFLENPSKSDDWFLNALNGAVSGLSDTSSVNCLLDLDDEIVEKKDVNVVVKSSGQDVQSIPDSGQETTSSFGSASSTPSHVNLPAIKVNISDNQLMDLPVSSGTVIREGSDPFVLYHERSEQGLQMGYVKTHQRQSTDFDLASTNSILSDLTITDQSSPVSQIQSSSSNNPAAYSNDTHDQNTRIQMLQQPQKNHNSSYLMSVPTTQDDSPRHYQLHHQQPQFIPQPQYIHHHPHPSVAVPVTSYYQHHPHPHHQPMDQPNFMYYIPTSQPPQGSYNFPLQQQQTNHANTRAAAATRTELPAGMYRTTSAGAPQLVRVQSGYQNQPQHVGYNEVYQPTQSVYYTTPLPTAHYQNMTSVSPVVAGMQEQQVRTAQHSHDR